MKWEIKNVGGEFLRIINENRKTIVDDVPDKYAALIAAAPELLEACKAFMNDPHVKECRMVNLEFVKDAIAKAERK